MNRFCVCVFVFITIPIASSDTSHSRNIHPLKQKQTIQSRANELRKQKYLFGTSLPDNQYFVAQVVPDIIDMTINKEHSFIPQQTNTTLEHGENTLDAISNNNHRDTFLYYNAMAGSFIKQKPGDIVSLPGGIGPHTNFEAQAHSSWLGIEQQPKLTHSLLHIQFAQGIIANIILNERHSKVSEQIPTIWPIQDTHQLPTFLHYTQALIKYIENHDSSKKIQTTVDTLYAMSSMYNEPSPEKDAYYKKLITKHFNSTKKDM